MSHPKCSFDACQRPDTPVVILNGNNPSRQRVAFRPTCNYNLAEKRLKKADGARDDSDAFDLYQRLVDPSETGGPSAGKDGCRNIRKNLVQNSPLICPLSSISIFSADGTAGRPGIRIIDPAMGTIKPAPDESSTLRIRTVKSRGLLRLA